MHEIATR